MWRIEKEIIRGKYAYPNMLLLVATSLRLKYVDGVFVLHFEPLRRVSLLDWITIEPEPNQGYLEALPIAVCLHQFSQWGVLKTTIRSIHFITQNYTQKQ